MRICIFGAGAVGGFLGARLTQAAAHTGDEISLVARGAHLQAMQAHGLQLRSGGQSHRIDVRATDDPAALGPQDHVIVTLKAHAAPAAAESLRPLLGPDTAVTFAVNGLPWWYFHALPGPLQGRGLETVDPGGLIARVVGFERALGCVVYTGAEVTAPGEIHHGRGETFLLGEPDDSASDRVTALSAALTAAGLDAPVRPDIRADVWGKLWGNLSFNPVSALTGETLGGMTRHEGALAVARAMMAEAETIAAHLGVAMPMSLDARIEETARMGEHKTSMLQDLEKGRSLEIGPVVQAIEELGALTGLPTPTIAIVRGLLELRAKTAAR